MSAATRPVVRVGLGGTAFVCSWSSPRGELLELEVEAQTAEQARRYVADRVRASVTVRAEP